MSDSTRLKLFIPIALFALMVGLLWFALSPNREPSLVPSALLNKPAPEFSLPGLFPGEGPYTKEDLLGTITVINVWGSWCPPCHIEHPFLLDVSEKEETIQFVGISYDDSTEADKEFLQDRGNPFYRNIVDMGGSLRIDLGVTGAPETFLLNKEGLIVHRHIGIIDFTVWEEDFMPVINMLRAD